MIAKAMTQAETIPPTTSTRMARRWSSVGGFVRRRLLGGFLHLLAGLPEEEVGRDGRPEDREQRGETRPAPARRGTGRTRVRDLGPVDVDRRRARRRTPGAIAASHRSTLRVAVVGARRSRGPSINAAMATVRTAAGSGTTRCAEAPIDARSAAMLNVFATATSDDRNRAGPSGGSAGGSGCDEPGPVTEAEPGRHLLDRGGQRGDVRALTTPARGRRPHRPGSRCRCRTGRRRRHR